MSEIEGRQRERLSIGGTDTGPRSVDLTPCDTTWGRETKPEDNVLVVLRRGFDESAGYQSYLNSDVRLNVNDSTACLSQFLL
jgi:hypothetical protein